MSAFPLFGVLPAEIRAMIWQYALPDARLFEVMDVPGARQTMAPAAGLMFAQAHNEPPPAMAAACRESRQIALRRYRPLLLGRTTKYVDLGRDILLLEPYLLLRRLQRTLRFLSRIALVRERLTTLALGTSYGPYTGVNHPALGYGSITGSAPDVACMARLLESLAQFPRLRTLLFVVHQEFRFEFDAAVTTTKTTPQLVHQSYNFQFDIEASINRHPWRRPHYNELLFYPLPVVVRNDDEHEDDWDVLLRGAAAAAAAAAGNGDGNTLLAGDLAGGDPWPSNDDWRRFKRRFQREVAAAVMGGSSKTGSSESGANDVCGKSSSGGKAQARDGDVGPQDYDDRHGLYGGWTSGQRGGDRQAMVPAHNLPAIRGASVLWRYTER